MKFCSNSLQYNKFTKVICASSNKTCSNAFCYLKVVARHNSYLSFGCGLKHPISNFRVNKLGNIEKLDFKIFLIQFYFQLAYKQFHYWRQVVDLKDLDACAITDTIDNFPKLAGQVDWFNTVFPKSIHRCPYDVFYLC